MMSWVIVGFLILYIISRKKQNTTPLTRREALKRELISLDYEIEYYDKLAEKAKENWQWIDVSLHRLEESNRVARKNEIKKLLESEMDYIILLLWNWHPKDLDSCWGEKRVLIKNDEYADANAQNAILEFCKLHNMSKGKNKDSISEYLLGAITEYKVSNTLTVFDYHAHATYDIDGVQVKNYIEVVAEYTNIYEGV